MYTTKSYHGIDSGRRFDLGRILITRSARAVLSDDEIRFALIRHRSGDWGEVNDQDALRNETALHNGDHLMSVFVSKRHIRFYLITEADRTLTTILLPHES